MPCNQVIAIGAKSDDGQPDVGQRSAVEHELVRRLDDAGEDKPGGTGGTEAVPEGADNFRPQRVGGRRCRVTQETHLRGVDVRRRRLPADCGEQFPGYGGLADCLRTAEPDGATGRGHRRLR